MLSEQEFNERTAYKCSYEEYKACYCPDCDRTDCIHRDAYRRLPKIDGGLGLCPNLDYCSKCGERYLRKLRNLHDKGCTDSDIIDFCEDNNLSRREAFHWIAIWTAPECCQGCKHIDLYPSMPPCSSCSRRYRDNYEKA